MNRCFIIWVCYNAWVKLQAVSYSVNTRHSTNTSCECLSSQSVLASDHNASIKRQKQKSKVRGPRVGDEHDRKRPPQWARLRRIPWQFICPLMNSSESPANSPSVSGALPSRLVFPDIFCAGSATLSFFYSGWATFVSFCFGAIAYTQHMCKSWGLFMWLES